MSSSAEVPGNDARTSNSSISSSVRGASSRGRALAVRWSSTDCRSKCSDRKRSGVSAAPSSSASASNLDASGRPATSGTAPLLSLDSMLQVAASVTPVGALSCTRAEQREAACTAQAARGREQRRENEVDEA